MSVSQHSRGNRNRQLILCLVVGISLITGSCEQEKVSHRGAQEQSIFGIEQEMTPVEKPVDIPEGVLHLLRQSEYVVRCLQGGQPPSDIPGSWFVGSEIHLNQGEEIDLVVLPRVLNEVPAPNHCLRGANVGGFWVFRQTPQGYDLVLEVIALGISVLESRSKGFRDIRAYSATVDTVTTLTFKFDGQKYRLHKKESKPIG